MHQEKEGRQFGGFEIQAMARVPNRDHEERCTERRLDVQVVTNSSTLEIRSARR